MMPNKNLFRQQALPVPFRASREACLLPGFVAASPSAPVPELGRWTNRGTSKDEENNLRF